MTTSINRSQIFTNAWSMVKSESISMSNALKKSWAKAKAAIVAIVEKVETIVLETIKYAGTMAYGFKESLIELSWKDRENGVLLASYADVEYPNGYNHKKQNECTMSATSGAAIIINTKGRTELKGLAEKFLSEAKTVEGKTFEIKSEIKAFGFSFDGSTKTWKK